MTPDTLLPLGGSATFTNESSGNPTTYLWTFQDGTPGSSSLKNPPAITFNVPGSKNVTLVVSNDYGTNTLVKTGYIYVGGVGINEHNGESLTIFPNPVKDVMTIQSSSNMSGIYLYNIAGQVVLSQMVNAKSITLNTSGLTSGIYNLKAITGNRTVNKKIVID